MKKLSRFQYDVQHAQHRVGLRQQANDLGRELGVDVIVRDGRYWVCGHSSPDLQGVRRLVALLQKRSQLGKST